MSPDVANLTQQRGQPGQKACHGLGGASLQPWPEDEGMEKGGVGWGARMKGATAGSREARAGVETDGGRPKSG